MEETTADAVAEETEPEAQETEVEVTPEAEVEDAGEEHDPEADDDEDQEDEAEVEMVDINYGGNKMSVPKDSVPEDVLQKMQEFNNGTWSDYTKKSQGIAEATKSLEARESVVQKMQGMQGEALDTYSRGLHLRQELEQLNGVDLNEMWQSDPDQARRYSDTISQKQAELNSVISRVNQYEQAMAGAQTAETVRRETEGRQIVERQIKGFTQKAPEVIEYAVKTFGINQKEAENWGSNPAAAITMYKAMLYDKMQTKANKATKTKVPTATPVKSIKGKGGKGTKNPGDMSTEEYATYWHNLQKRQKKE